MNITHANPETHPAISQVGPIEAWFDDFIAQVRSHQLQLTSGVASDELARFYKNLFTGNVDEIVKQNRRLSQQYFVQKIIVDYLQLLGNRASIRKIAFDYNDAGVLVWVETENDDDEVERTLILAQAKINASFHDSGYDLDTTIVEERDNQPIPNHYKPL